MTGRRELGLLALAFVVATSWTTGMAGLDHGLHWDEWYEVTVTREAIQGATMAEPPATNTLQNIYYGLYFVPGKLVVLAHALPHLPDVVKEIASGPRWPYQPNSYPSMVQMREELLAFVETTQFKLECRAVFLTLSCLAPIFVFLTVLTLFPRRHLVAAAAAGFIALSFEVATHSRWIAVDGPQVAVVALELWMIARALTSRTRLRAASSLLLASVAAGLALSCKATGLFALLPIFASPLIVRSTFPSRRERAALLATGVFLAFCVFVLLTPRAQLDPLRIFNTINLTRSDYGSSNHANAVSGPLEHAWRFGIWWVFFVGSPYRIAAAFFAVVSALGVWTLTRTRKKLALAWGAFAVVLLALLISQRLLIVRNYLQLTPLYALAFAAGLITLSHRLRDRPFARSAGAALVALILCANGASLAHAAWTIRSTTQASILDDTVEHLRASSTDLRVSPRLFRAIGERLEETHACGAPDASAELVESRVAMYYHDHDAWSWTTNRVGFVERTFAPRITNFDFYSTWRGRFEEHRVVVLREENALEMEVSLRAFRVCRPR